MENFLQPHSPFHAVWTRHVLPFCIFRAFLHPANYACVETVSKAFVMIDSIENFIRTWMQHHDLGQIIIAHSLPCRLPGPFGNVCRLYHQYQAVKLMCLFLLQTQETLKQVVVAGSFPMLCEAQRIGNGNWRPNDIDIFVFERAHLCLVGELFIAMVLEPMGFRGTKSTWKTSFQRKTAEEVTDSIHTPEGKSGSFQDDSEYAPDLPFPLLSESQIRNLASQWIRKYAKKTHNKKLHNFLLSETQGDYDLDPNGVLHTLWQTLDHVPPELRSPSYQVVESIKILPQLHFNENANQLATLIPINVIYIMKRNVRDSSADAREFVCNGFDLAACCVSLTVRQDLQFELQCFNDAAFAIRKERLRFTPCAFATQGDSVSITMARVLKYVQRGAAW